MIIRVWRGRTMASDASRHESYLRGYDGYRKTEGHEEAFLLRRPLGNETEFVLISLWRSMEAIERYAGSDAERANLHGLDKALLSSADTKAVHYELAFRDSE
jgi:heme-degrading monooxygenase HmoA